jgi:hypothetical protein
VRAVVYCRVREIAIALEFIVIISRKRPINLVSNPNSVNSHLYTSKLVSEVVELENALDSHAINATIGFILIQF